MSRLVWGGLLLLALVCGLPLQGHAAPRTLTLLQPQPLGDAAVDAAAELGVALEREVARSSRWRRVGEPLSADELLAAFGCIELNLDCARAAGRAAQARVVLLTRLEPRGQALEVEATLVPVGPGLQRRARWRITGLRAWRSDRVLGPTMAHLASLMLAQDGPDGRKAGMLTLGPGSTVSINGRARPIGRVHPLPVGVHRVQSPGLAEIELELTPGQIEVMGADTVMDLFVDPPPPARQGNKLAWLSAGVGGAALAGFTWAGLSMRSTQSDLDAARTGPEVEDLSAQGQNQARIANAFLLVGAAAVGLSIYLFMDP